MKDERFAAMFDDFSILSSSWQALIMRYNLLDYYNLAVKFHKACHEIFCDVHALRPHIEKISLSIMSGRYNVRAV